MLKVDLSGMKPFVETGTLKKETEVKAAFKTLLDGEGKGSEYTGWIRLPQSYDRTEMHRIKQAAQQINEQSEALVVIGIGGSYLGARAAIDLLKSPNYNITQKSTPDIYFVGNNLSAAYIDEVIRQVKNRNFSVNIISKSGTTTEPAIAFRIFREMLEVRYGAKGAMSRIYATTDKSSGALRTMADLQGYETFVVPDNIGGRYSVLTPVGLLPMAVAGIDIDAVMDSAALAMDKYISDKSMDNPVWQYAAARQALYRTGKNVEILAFYEPSFRYMAEWWKQLFGESEGKDGKGIFPASVELTADLHSMGQYIQDGQRFLMETAITFESFGPEITVPYSDSDRDGLGYLEGKSLQYINAKAGEATAKAHIGGGVPNIGISLEKMDEAAFGYLVYFFQLSCGLSGYMTGVNPFDQPGVEAYKKNMFKLLGKPGY